MNFWQSDNKIIAIQAPMEDVTDAAFRKVIAKNGKPDIMMSEFTSADGITSPGFERLKDRLLYDESERPIVLQLFSSQPEKMFKAAEIARSHGFDGIDINMGCPDKNVCGQGSGAALIKTPLLAQDLIKAALDGSGGLPVSVKTRIGFSNISFETWVPNLLEQPIAGLTVHLRTRKEMSKVPAHWELAEKIAEIKNMIRPETKLIGNGDIKSYEEGINLSKKNNLDGFMVGRGIYGNPWFFNQSLKKEDLGKNTILETLIEHIQEFDKLLGGNRHFVIMRKHFKSYLSGLGVDKNKLLDLLNSNSAEEAISIINSLK